MFKLDIWIQKVTRHIEFEFQRDEAPWPTLQQKLGQTHVSALIISKMVYSVYKSIVKHKKATLFQGHTLNKANEWYFRFDTDKVWNKLFLRSPKTKLVSENT